MSTPSTLTVFTLAFGLVALGLAGAALAQPAGPPRISPMATVSQVVGLAKVEITYSRPYVKGREVFGGLEPWGKVWRTGANEATTFALTDDAEIEGKSLPAGTYSLFTIPSEEGKWTVIFNKEANQWGAFQYDKEKDALRVEVAPETVHHHEMFTIAFTDVTDHSAMVNVVWKETRVPFTIGFDTDAIAQQKASQDFEAAKAEPDRQHTQGVYQWANYFRQQGDHLDRALEMAEWVAQQQESYWTTSLRARLLAANGRQQEAVTTAQKAMELGKKAQEENANAFMATNMEQLEGEMKDWQAD
jgi:tetratricopeptide (TPR) repeat protein